MYELKQKDNFILTFENSVKECWNKQALDDYNSCSVTYGELAADIEKLVLCWKAAGLKKGDKIVINAKSSSSDAEGLGFAIPINTAMEMAKQMIEKGYVARPAMGVTVITINDAQTAMQYGVSNYGVYIYQIASGSGAEKGGLKLGDRIISIDDVAVSSASDVQKYCQSKEVGDTVTLQVERDGKVISCEVTLGESTQSTATAESGN